MATQTPSAKAIFEEAVEIPSAAERQAFLDRVCADSPELRLKIDALLRAYDEAGSFLESPATAPALVPAFDEPLIERPGTMIGPYKLMEQIGEGGMGLVFVAEQQEPVRRKVALKIIKPGMDSRNIIARFEAERQALALMDHPNIAKILDAGTTGSEPRALASGSGQPVANAPGSGRPYFVMELVKGVPITDYCDQHQVPIRERLELFVSVCQAVQHAHQKGIIHRDLKPSNVLVTLHDGTPVVKVIDFGIAKATGQQLTDKTVYTQFAQLIGTPMYMSPEQAALSGLDVDTRSDVYSLGVLLYELLTGTTPFDRERLRDAGYDEMRRIIREEEPPRPSTRISTLGQAATTLSTQRRSDPKRLSSLCRGELDWIVMKCLEKDRNRRYETANGLALDVQRYLADEPVQACPPSGWYRLRKLVRRHKGKVTAASAMLALVLAGSAASIWQALRATRAEQRTGDALANVTAAQAQTREALDALIEDVVETMFTRQSELGEKEKAFLRKVLAFYETFTEQSAETAEARFLRAKGYYTVAHLRALLGEHLDAVAGYLQSAALLEQLAADFPEVAEYRHKLARTEGNLGIELAKLGKQGHAETAFRRGIELRTQLVEEMPTDFVYRSELAGNYNDLGFLRELQHNHAEAEDNYHRALQHWEWLAAQAGDQRRYSLELSHGLANLGQLLRLQGKYEESEKVYRRALEIREEQMSKGPPTAKDRQRLANCYSGLGIALAEQKRMEEAATALRQALEVRRKLVDDFPSLLEYRRELAGGATNLAYFLTRQGKDAAAEEPYRQALELRKEIVKRAGPVPGYRRDLAASYHDLAWVLSVTGRPKEAESQWHAALELWQQLVADLPRNPDYQSGLGGTLTNLARLHNQRGEFPDAADLLEKAQTHLEAALDARSKDHDFRESYRDYLVALAQCRLGLADHVRAAAAAGELARFGFEPVKDTYDAACLLGRCVTVAGKDASLPEAKRKELSQGHAQQALALLQLAVKQGFRDVSRMNKDRDLEPLRSREEYRKLLADLEASNGNK